MDFAVSSLYEDFILYNIYWRLSFYNVYREVNKLTLMRFMWFDRGLLNEYLMWPVYYNLRILSGTFLKAQVLPDRYTYTYATADGYSFYLGFIRP